MTRRTYIALADALKRSKPDSYWHPWVTTQWKADCTVVATALHDENPSFDVQRFLSDCGVQL